MSPCQCRPRPPKNSMSHAGEWTVCTSPGQSKRACPMSRHPSIPDSPVMGQEHREGWPFLRPPSPPVSQSNTGTTEGLGSRQTTGSQKGQWSALRAESRDEKDRKQRTEGNAKLQCLSPEVAQGRLGRGKIDKTQGGFRGRREVGGTWQGHSWIWLDRDACWGSPPKSDSPV